MSKGLTANSGAGGNPPAPHVKRHTAHVTGRPGAPYQTNRAWCVFIASISQSRNVRTFLGAARVWPTWADVWEDHARERSPAWALWTLGARHADRGEPACWVTSHTDRRIVLAGSTRSRESSASPP